MVGLVTLKMSASWDLLMESAARSSCNCSTTGSAITVRKSSETSGEIKGRYPLNITNSDELTYLEDSELSSWEEEARADLGKNVMGVISERLALERD